MLITQLLEIKTIPLKYEIHVEHAKLEVSQDFLPEADITQVPAKLKLHSQNTQVQIDTYQARHSLGLANMTDFMAEAAQRGKESWQQSISNAISDGKQMGSIENGTTIPQIVRQKTISDAQQAGLTYTAFLPSGGAQLSWEPGGVTMEYVPGETKYDWDIKGHESNYVPGGVSFEVVQWPDVEIKYIGGPLYFPPSANPNYAPPDGPETAAG